MHTKKNLRSLLILCFLLKNSTALQAKAPDYVPPSTPELYEKKADLTPHSVVFSEGLFVGSYGSLGIARSSSYGNPSTYYQGALNLGYRFILKDWNFWQVSVDFFTAHLETSKSEYKYNWGTRFRTGYGYLIADSLHGIFSLAFELASADYEGEVDDEDLKSQDSLLGTGLSLDYILDFRAFSKVHFFTGLGWGFHFFNVKDVHLKDTNQKKKVDSFQSFNTPRVYLGMQFFL